MTCAKTGPYKQPILPLSNVIRVEIRINRTKKSRTSQRSPYLSYHFLFDNLTFRTTFVQTKIVLPLFVTTTFFWPNICPNYICLTSFCRKISCPTAHHFKQLLFYNRHTPTSVRYDKSWLDKYWSDT